METTILVDIDGVLATRNLPRLLSIYADVLNLAIPVEQLARVRSLEAFHALPQAQAHLIKVGAARYQNQLVALRFHPHYVAACHMIPGAVQGVRYLAKRCNALSYCTARVINFSKEWNADLAHCTWIWLANNAFPNENSTLFCDGPKAKLIKIIEMIREQAQHVLLIDDSLEMLRSAYHELPNEDQHFLSEHFTLAAYGYEECDQESLLNIVPFPCWAEVHNLAVNLPVEKEFKDYDTRQRWQPR